MPARLAYLQQTLSAYQSTGVSLVQVHGATIGPAARDDDPGLYYVVPKLAALLRIPVGQAAELFLYSICVVGLAVGIVGILFYCRTIAGKVFGSVAILAVITLAARLGDVYVAAAVIPVACVPWLLWIARRHLPSASFVALPLIGVVAAAANLLRGQSGTATLLFGVILLLLSAGLWRQRLRDVGLLLLGAAVVYVAFAGVIYQRDAYIASQPQTYRPDNVGHPFWHTIYVGFGYVPNPYVPAYLDSVGLSKARQIDPSVAMYSKRYEEILRGQVLDLVRDHPGFVAQTVGAKAWMIVTYLLVFVNIGLIAAWRTRKPPPIGIAFGAALAFAALSGFLAIPRTTYLLGFLAFCVLFAAVSVDDYAEREPRRVLLLAGPFLGAAAVLAGAGIDGVYGPGSSAAAVPFQVACAIGWALCVGTLVHLERGAEEADGMVPRQVGGNRLSVFWAKAAPPILLTALGIAVTLLLRDVWISAGAPKVFAFGSFSLLIIAGAGSALVVWVVESLGRGGGQAPDSDGVRIAGNQSSA